MKNDRLAALVTAVSLTFMKSSKPQYCLASRKLNSIWKRKAVKLDDFIVSQFQVSAEQNDVGLGWLYPDWS